MDIRQQITEVQRQYPTLTFSPESNSFSGEIYATEFDPYQIRIEINTYPDFFPTVFETEDRIPKKADRHVYSHNGACCLTTSANAQILLKTKIKTLKSFIKEIVIPYLQNNSFYEIHKKYNTEEYAHNFQGIIDGYKDILKIENETIIGITILNYLNKPKLKIHHPCYCGSGHKLKSCSSSNHEKAYRTFRLIDKEVLNNDLIIITELLIQKGALKL